MAIFSRSSDPEKARTRQERATKAASARKEKLIAKMMRCGIATEGVVELGESLVDGHTRFLLVFEDRIELHDLGKTTSILKKGAQFQQVPFDKISSIGGQQSGLYHTVSVVASGTSIEFKSNAFDGQLLLQTINRIFNTRGTGATNPPSTMDNSAIPDQIRKLSELKDAGVLTDEEFQKKKSELLDRL